MWIYKNYQIAQTPFLGGSDDQALYEILYTLKKRRPEPYLIDINYITSVITSVLNRWKWYQ